MTDVRLDKDQIADPSIYSLLIRIGVDRIDVVVYSVMSDNSLIYRSYPISTAGSRSKSFEDVVYDNPLILCDFRKISILLDTKDYAVIPYGLTESESHDIFHALHPSYTGTVSLSDTRTRNASVVYGMENDMYGFLQRTFPSVSVAPHIVPLVRYFASKPGRGNSRRMICNFRPGHMDVVILDGNLLVMANTLSFRTVMDAAYFILAIRSYNHLDAHADELLLSGDQGIREEITPVLRTYVERVMPVIFPPQMFRAGKEAMKAPFDLIVTPLCE